MVEGKHRAYSDTPLHPECAPYLETPGFYGSSDEGESVAGKDEPFGHEVLKLLLCRGILFA